MPNTDNLKKSKATSRKINLPVAIKQKRPTAVSTNHRFETQRDKALVERSLLIPTPCPLLKLLPLQTQDEVLSHTTGSSLCF